MTIKIKHSNGLRSSIHPDAPLFSQREVREITRLMALDLLHKDREIAALKWRVKSLRRKVKKDD